MNNQDIGNLFNYRDGISLFNNSNQEIVYIPNRRYRSQENREERRRRIRLRNINRLYLLANPRNYSNNLCEIALKVMPCS